MRWLKTKTAVAVTVGLIAGAALMVAYVARAALPVTPTVAGGMGTSTAPGNGKIPIGDANGNYEFVASSTLGAVNSVFGRSGAVTAQSGDYTTSLVTEGSNLYFTNARSDARFVTDLAGTTSVSSIITLPSLALPYAQLTGAPTFDTFPYPFPGGATTTNVAFSNGITIASLNGLVAANSGTTYAAASSTLFGTGTGGQILAWSNGVPKWIASTTYSADFTFANNLLSLAANSVGVNTSGGLTGGGSVSLGNSETLSLATIAANSVLANKTGATAAPTAVATSSLFQNASASVSGLLSSTDWSTFNGKQATIGITWPITLSGSTVGFNGLSTTTNLTPGQVPYVTGANTFGQLATTTASCAGTASCTAFTIFGSSPITITGSGGGSAAYPFPAAGNATTSLVGFLGGLTATNIQATSTATSTIANDNTVLWVPTNFATAGCAGNTSYTDFGKCVNGLYSLASTSGQFAVQIMVPDIKVTSAQWTTPINFGTNGEIASFDCVRGATLIYGGTGTSTLFNMWNPSGHVDSDDYGCTYQGNTTLIAQGNSNSKTTVGIGFGGGNGSVGVHFHDNTVNGYGINIQVGQHAYILSITNNAISGGNSSLKGNELFFEVANDSGERNVVDDNSITDPGGSSVATNAIFITDGAAASTFITKNSLDNVQIYTGTSDGLIDIDGNHIENAGCNYTNYIPVSGVSSDESTQITFSNNEIANDCNGSTGGGIASFATIIKHGAQLTAIGNHIDNYGGGTIATFSDHSLDNGLESEQICQTQVSQGALTNIIGGGGNLPYTQDMAATCATDVDNSFPIGMAADGSNTNNIFSGSTNVATFDNSGNWTLLNSLSVGSLNGLIGAHSGLLYAFASSSLFGYTPLNPTRNINTTYPIQGGGNLSADRTLSLAFGTSTSNTWGGTQTFTAAPILSNLTGLIAGNSGNTYAIASSTLWKSIATSTATIYINSSRHDSYTADGTILYPYTTITAANAAVTAAGLASAVYSIAPGTNYTEQSMTMPNIPLVIYGQGANIILLSGASVGAGTMTFPNDIDFYDPVIFGNVVESDTSLSNPHTFNNGFIAGSITAQGLATFSNTAEVDQNTGAFPFLSQSASSTFTAQAGSLVNMNASDIQNIIIDRGIFNLDDDNVQTATSTQYAVTATSTGSQLNISGASIQNFSSGGCINSANGATIGSPNSMTALTCTVGAGTTNNISVGSAVSYLSKYTSYTVAGVRLYASGSGLSAASDAALNVEGNSILNILTGSRTGLGTSTPFANLSIQANNGDTSQTLFAIGSSTLTSTSTLFSISNTGAIQTAMTGTQCVHEVNGLLSGTGSDCGSGGSSFAYPFIAGATSSPLMLLASTTIGNGTQGGGLTISGGATTTGNMFIQATGNSLAGIQETMTSQSGVRELLQKDTVSDAANDAFYVMNGTATDGRFLPQFAGISDTTATNPSLIFRGWVTSANDTGSSPIEKFDVQEASSASSPQSATYSAITTRPIVDFENNDVPQMTLLANGADINKNGDVLGEQASYVVSTSTATGNFTDVQSAINALGNNPGLIFVRCGTYALPSGNVGIDIKANGQRVIGSGLCTNFTMDKANTSNAVGWNVAGLTDTEVGNFQLTQTNATFGAVGINASNTPIVSAHDIAFTGFATTTMIKDSANQSFYAHFSNMDMRGNTTCYDIGSSGNPANDSVIDGYERCGPQAGNKGFGYYFNSSSVNGAQAWEVDNPNVEPVGSGTGITAFYFGNAVDIDVENAYAEGNGVGWNLSSGSQRIKIHGGEFVSNTTYINAGSNNEFDTDKESQAYNLIMASTTIQDVSGNDATVNDLSFRGNTNFSKVGNMLDLVFANTSDTGIGLHIVDPGTGNAIQVDSGTTSLQHLKLNNLNTRTTGNAVCILTGGEVVTAGNTTCTTSSKYTKQDIVPIPQAFDAIAETMKLQVVEFAYIDSPTITHYGLIAEQVEQIDPKLVQHATATTSIDGHTFNVGDPISIDTEHLSDGLLVRDIQELQGEIEGLGGHTVAAVTESAVDNRQDWELGFLFGAFVTYVVYNEWDKRRRR